MLMWQQPEGAGAPPLPAMAEFEGFPCVTGLLDGAAALAAAGAALTAERAAAARLDGEAASLASVSRTLRMRIESMALRGDAAAGGGV